MDAIKGVIRGYSTIFGEPLPLGGPNPKIFTKFFAGNLTTLPRIAMLMR